MNDPADAIARLSSRLSELDERKYASSQAISKLQKQLASVQANVTELDNDCLAELGAIAEYEEQLGAAVQECAELEQQAVNSEEESKRKQKRYTEFRSKSRQALLSQLESWDSFDGPGVGRHMVQLQLRQQAAQHAQTTLHQSTEERKLSMKAAQEAISTQQSTNHLLHAEHQLARQVISKEKELAALRQRSAILTAETVKFNQSEAELQAAHESKTKELREVEQAIIDATRVSTEPPAYTSSIGCPQPVPQHTSQQQLKQHECKQSNMYQHNHHHVPSPGFGSCATQPMAPAASAKAQAAPNHSWDQQQPVLANHTPPWPSANVTTASTAPPTQQTTHCQPVSAAYTVEEPDSPDASGPGTDDTVAPDTTGPTVYTEELPAQDNATHVLMRKVECKRNSKGVPIAPKLRVREVYARIDANGQRQTLAAERILQPGPGNAEFQPIHAVGPRSQPSQQQRSCQPNQTSTRTAATAHPCARAKAPAPAPAPTPPSQPPCSTQHGPGGSFKGTPQHRAPPHGSGQPYYQPSSQPSHQSYQKPSVQPPTQQSAPRSAPHTPCPTRNSTQTAPPGQHSMPIVHHPPLYNLDKRGKASSGGNRSNAVNTAPPAPVKSTSALQMLGQKSFQQQAFAAYGNNSRLNADSSNHSSTLNQSGQVPMAPGVNQQPVCASAKSTCFKAVATVEEGGMPRGAWQPPAAGSAGQQFVPRTAFQGGMLGADAVPNGGVSSSSAAHGSTATAQPGGTPSDAGKRKGVTGKPAAKKAAKKASAQAKKGAATFQFDVFGSKL